MDSRDDRDRPTAIVPDRSGATGSAGSAPVIGVTSYLETARWSDWNIPAVLLPVKYVKAITEAGGVPVVLPPLPGLIEQVLPRLDGLLLSGGPDIEPARYGEEAGPHTAAPRRDRDGAELALVQGGMQAQLPVLGVCRGMQLLNVSRGGSLIQHLPDMVGHQDHAPEPGVYGEHAVTVEPGTRLAEVLGRDEAVVPTYHHQGIARLGSDLIVTAVAEDGTIEAVEDPGVPFCLAVQWHPEAGPDRSLFVALVEAARAHRDGRDHPVYERPPRQRDDHRQGEERVARSRRSA